MNWDLSPLFSSIPEAEEFLKQAIFKAKEFEKKYKNRLYTLNPDEFIEVLKEYEEIWENIGRALTYIYLEFATDSSKGNFLAKFQELATQAEEHLIWFELEFIHLPLDKQQRFIDNAGVYKYYLIHLQEEAPYKLSEKEEKILMKKDLTSSSAFVRLFDETISKLKFFFDGEFLSEEEILSKLYSPNRDERKKAQVSLTLGLKPHQDNFSFIYNQIKKDWKIDYIDIRGYDDPESPRHLSNRVSKKSVDALINAVNNSTFIVAEYYKIKKNLLGYDKLYDYDRYAPVKLTNKNPEISFEEAKELVLNAFSKFSPTFFYEIAKKAFEERWIDVYPKEGKRSGAFSHSATPKVHPYVLLNYTNQRRDVFTLAHELGHAIHQYLAKEVGYLNQDTPLTTAETASIFAEMLLFEEIKNSLSKEELIEVYAAKLEDIFATLFRQVVFTNFERRVHNSEELKPNEYNKIWIEENQKMFKDSVYLTKNYEIWWSYIPHFIHSPFYCYAYSYAQLLVLSLYKLYKEGFENFEEKYIKFLSQGGSIPPKKQFLELFNIDIEKEDFWNKGIDVVKEMLNEFKGITSDYRK
ncbi:M3 family oligoendopeptidase [Caminibacter mediatlanticus]|uniref:Oligoendopeptidase F n=1 Tax=Caminibacter mediatlanticus TB-2 TaxID=391592 RepID=A0AAI9AJ30_9BACT|nr:M3 family oligoendopeptidase [Caminibacter mediatlanticus]EDM24490.1 oligoendopeptidase F [Caminibacter mediatlanticus TB-2]